MDTQHLIGMANQIGQFFSAYPDPEEARASIATHIKKFWAPTMRQAMLDTLATPQAATLMPLVVEASTQHAAELRPSASSLER
jgi:formate dehydrogenase subunit delta